MTEAQYLKWLCLKSAPELPLRACLAVLEQYPNPEEYVGNAQHEIYRSNILKANTIKHLQEEILPKNSQQIIKHMQQSNIKCISYCSPEYPETLKSIFAPPLLLYVRGDITSALDAVCLAVVGTRKTSAYGREMTSKVIAPLCEMGVTILSGLAQGIDTIAHQVAINKGSKTIAVLASGLESIYPPQNLDLANKIIERGALISEYEPGTKIEKWNFPARNRIISALARGVLIVEGPITSGAMLTAKNAIEQNREVYAIPGNINNENAQGPNHLIKNGAYLVSSAEDLANYLGVETHLSDQLEILPSLSIDEQTLYDIVNEQQCMVSFDELLVRTGFSIGRLSTHLTNLELKGVFAKESGNSFFIR